jgi:hypothetical protein
MRIGVAPLTAVALDAEADESSAIMDGAAIAAGAQDVMELHSTRREAQRTVRVAFRTGGTELGGVNLLMIRGLLPRQ